jgi:hypothetical protein
MSGYIDDKDVPVTYSINIKTLSTSKRPLTCYISTTPRLTKQLNYIKPSIHSNNRIKSSENNHRSSIQLPVSYSTSIHVPCHPSTITLRPPTILPSQLSHHHYHHHYYYHHHHNHRQPPPPPSPRLSTTIKPTSIGSTRPATTSTTTTSSPQSLSLSKKSNKNIHSSLPNPTSTPFNKQPSNPLPSYSTLVWNWFHHTPTKPQSPHKGSQSDYSEVHRHDLPSKRSLLFKLLTSPTDTQSKSKHHRTCFRRKRFESSSSLPNKTSHYNE